MQIIREDGLEILQADTGKLLRDKNDNGYTYIDEEGNEVFVPPYRTDKIYLGIQIQTLEQAQELYVEEEDTNGI